MKKVGFLTGRPFSGKGTISRIIEESYGGKILSMSSILDKFRKEMTSSGETVGEIMDRGENVPVQIVTSSLEKEIESVGEDLIIVDGFPRDTDQASFLETQKRFLPIVFYIEVPKSICLRRVDSATGRGNRADDDPEIIKIRQNTFERETLPAIKYLEGGGVTVVRIDGKNRPEGSAYSITKSLRLSDFSNSMSRQAR